MDKNFVGRDAAVVSALCFITGVLLTWAFTSHQDRIQDSEVNWADWFQATGSIMAIVVAIVVPWRLALQNRDDLRARELRDRNERATERSARAKSYAFVLLPHIDEAQGQLYAAKRRWDRFPFADDDIIELLTIPDGITTMLLQMHEVSDAGNEVRAIVQGIRDLRGDVAYFSSYYRNGGEHYDSNNQYVREMEDHVDVDLSFERVIATVARARDSLAKIVAGNH